MNKGAPRTGEGSPPIAFALRSLSAAENSYFPIENQGLVLSCLERIFVCNYLENIYKSRITDGCLLFFGSKMEIPAITAVRI